MPDAPVPPPGDQRGPIWPEGIPSGQLILELRSQPLPSAASLSSPELRIDGFPAAAHWGHNEIWVPAGHRRLTVSTNATFSIRARYGLASFAVDVGPGQRVPVHYSAPYFVFQAGNIGFERQPHAGRVIWVLALAGCAVVLILGVVLAIIFGGSW